MQAQLPLEAITLVLKELEGYFVFSTSHGEYVVMRREDFDELKISAKEQQLSLPASPARPEPSEDVERINRDIALQRALEGEEEIDDLGLSAGDEIELPREVTLPRGTTVRFEPLKGDLPPELQE